MVIRVKPAKESIIMEPVAMDQEKFSYWLDAIENDNEKIVRNSISNADTPTRQQLINGHFTWEEDLSEISKRSCEMNTFDNCKLSRPWCLAGAYCSVKTIEVFLNYGVDVNQLDSNNVNILHAMINMAIIEPDMEVALCQTYKRLCQLLSTDQLRILLHGENSNGLRPIELAVHLGTFGLFNTMFETEDIYLVRQEQRSLFTIQWFDVTEYESVKAGQDRRLLSPLVMSMFCEKKRLEYKSTKTFFESNIIKSWFHMKSKLMRWPVLIWALIRIAIVALLWVYDATGGWADVSKISLLNRLNGNESAIANSLLANYSCWMQRTVTSSGRFYANLGVIFILFCVCSTFFDIVEAIRIVRVGGRWRLHTPNGKKDVLVNISFYRLMQFLLSFSMSINMVGAMLALFLKINIPRIVSDITYIVSMNSAIWSLLYFMQILPWIGYFVIAIQRMVSEMFKFILIFLIFIVPFGLNFSRLIVRNIRGDCPPEFENDIISLYSTVTILFNMINFQSFNLEHREAVYIFHVFFCFISSILLLNFLIANFTTSAIFVEQNVSAIQMVQRMSVYWPCEDRLACMFPSLVRILHKKSFTYDKTNDRIYVTCVQIRKASEKSQFEK